MDDFQYTEPVKQLLTYGDARKIKGRKWPQYQDCGLTHEHIPELLRMLTDERLHYADSDCMEVWAPLHAWRALGQLHAVEAIPSLLDLLHHIDDYDDDWIGDEFPEVFAMIGEPAIPALTTYLAIAEHGLFARVCAANSLSKIGKARPDTHRQCVESLEQQLTRYRSADPTLNGFLVSFLIKLGAIEALDIIRQAYQQECVDLSILGDLEDAEIELGIRQKRSTPRPRLYWGFKDEPVSFPKSAQQIPVRVGKKVGRNDPCPCGSGKKYKKCCLNKS